MKKRNLLQEFGIRSTRPRRDILDVILSLGRRHFSVEDILNYIEISRRKYRVSRASTFRTIKLFSQKGLLNLIDLGKDCYFYELAVNSQHHDHLYCLKCGKIMEFKDYRIERLQKKVCLTRRFYPLMHTLRIIGFCSDCKEAG